MVVVVELRVEAADGAILARDREQPVEGVRDEHVVKAEVLGFVRNRDESVTVEGGSLEHPRRWLGAQWPGLCPGECHAAQSAQAGSAMGGRFERAGGAFLLPSPSLSRSAHI